jgi:hypothetical protein
METKLKATPGPWVLHLRDKTKTARVNGADGIYITQRDFTSNTAADQERIVSDLHLIAAAPDLYAVLSELEESCEYWSEYDVPLGMVDRIKSALKRARGEE